MLLVALGQILNSLGLRPIAWLLVLGAAGLSVVQLARPRPLQSRWQVPEPWRRVIDPDVLALLYGFLLGTGVLTAVVVSAFWVFVTLTLVASPLAAISAWMIYGVVRGMSFVATSQEKPQDQRARQILVLWTTTLAVWQSPHSS